MKTLKIILLLVLIFTVQPVFAQEFVYVSVEKAELKDGTGFFTNKIAQVEYGTKLIVLENSIKDKWIKVAEDYNEKNCGWILSSNVTKKRVINNFNNNSNSSKEIALAGKGFSEGDISANKVDFSSVEIIENFSKNQNIENLKKFIQEGNLKSE